MKQNTNKTIDNAKKVFADSKEHLRLSLNKPGISDDVIYLAAHTFCEIYRLLDDLNGVENKLFDGLLEDIASGERSLDEGWQKLRTGLFSADEVFGDDDKPCRCGNCELGKALSKLKGEPWHPGDDELEVGIEFGTTTNCDGYAFHAKVIKLVDGVAYVDVEPRENCDDMTDDELRQKVRETLQDFHPEIKEVKVKLIR